MLVSQTSHPALKDHRSWVVLDAGLSVGSTRYKDEGPDYCVICANDGGMDFACRPSLDGEEFINNKYLRIIRSAPPEVLPRHWAISQ